MYRCWVMEIANSVFRHFHRTHYINCLAEAMYAHIFTFNTIICYGFVYNGKNLFCHVYSNNICLKIVNNVMRKFLIAAISGLVWQPHCILRPLSKGKLVVTNLSKLYNNEKHISTGEYCKSIANKSWFTENHILAFGHFRQLTFWKWPLGSHEPLNCGCYYRNLYKKYMLQLNETCLLRRVL